MDDTSPAIDENALAQLRTQLEAVSSGEHQLTDEQIINLFYPVGAQTYSPGDVTYRSLILPRTFCRNLNLLDASGQVTTDAGGTATFLLTQFICSTVNDFMAPVNLQATPFSGKPVFVTMGYKLVPNPTLPGSFNDLEITLRTWSAGGTAAPSTVVDWRVRLVSNQIIG
jgi:hypothetical protein